MKLNVLLLCNKPSLGADANTILDHINAIEDYSQHDIWTYSFVGELDIRLDLEQFDVVIIHYSTSLLKNYYLGPKSKEKIREYQGLKVVFAQDEYRQIYKMNDELAFLKIDVLFTCFPPHEFESIYPQSKLPGVAMHNNLTGYIPVRLGEQANQPLIAERKMHVGYRGRKLGYWYGELAFEKWNIVEKWAHHVAESDLSVDLSYHEKDRLYGKKWVDFLSSCKTTLGVESGTSVMDFTGEIEKEVDCYQLNHPEESFYEVQAKFLLSHEGKHALNQISPRCFEAIALKTALVLYEGEYSDILVPGRHYIPLKKDFSNITEVLTLIRDDDFLQQMVDRAFVEIAQNPDYGYPAFVHRVDEIILNEFSARGKSRPVFSYTKERFEKDAGYLSMKTRLKTYLFSFYQRLPYHVRVLIKSILRPLR